MSAGDPDRTRFERALDEIAGRGRKVRFWWRDDDAERPTPELARLFALAGRHDLPLGLAVIPAGAVEQLAAAVNAAPLAAVLQHGWSHANHAAPGEKKQELGADRPVAAIVQELRAGRQKLAALFGDRFLPVLVPPWNRIADEVVRELGGVRFGGLSTFGPAESANPQRVNTHLDIFDWTNGPRPLTPDEAYAVLAREARRRLDGEEEPIGILTHHLRHTPESWSLLDELFGLLAGHPAISWPPIAALFPV
jgi:hypothetical protein